MALDLALALPFATARSGLDGASDAADVDFMVLGPSKQEGIRSIWKRTLKLQSSIY